MPTYIEALGMQSGGQAAGNLINEGMGIAFADIKNRQQARQHKRLTNINIDAEKHLTDFNMLKQLEMWEKTGYGAQVDQMKRAGINPGLLYGMGGGGGQTANVETGSAGATGAETAKASHGSEGMGIQSALMKSQIANIDADTKLKEAEAKKKSGVDTVEGETRIEDLKQGIENKKTLQKLTEIEIQLKELQKKYDEATLEDRVTMMGDQAGKILNELAILQNEAQMSTELFETKKLIVYEQLSNIIADTALKQSGEAKNQAEILKMAQDIAQGWAKISIASYEADIKAFEADMKAKYPGLWNVIGGVALETARRIGNIFGDKNPGNNAPKK